MNGSKNKWHILQPLFRGIPILLFTTFVSFFIAKKYLKYTTPEYESTAKIKLADIHEGVNNSNLFKDLDVFVTTNKIGAEVELLKSQTLVQKVTTTLPLNTTIYRVGDIHKTELYKNSPFKLNVFIKQKKWLEQNFKIHIYKDSLFHITFPNGKIKQGKFNQQLSNASATIIISRNDTLLKTRPELQVNGDYEFTQHSQAKVVNDLISGLDIMAVDKDISVLRISYKCPVAEKTADVVNTLSAVYIADYIEQKYKSADTTEDFLNKQLYTYSQKLSSSENALEQYRDQNNIINIPQEIETDLRKIADLKKQLASVKMNLNAIDSLSKYMKSGRSNWAQLAPNFEAYSDMLSTELIKKAKELQRERSDLLLIYTPTHEKVTVMDEKLKDINDYLQEGIKNTQSSLRIKYRVLIQSIQEAEKVFIGLPEKEKSMTILERNFGLNDEVYRFLQGKRTEAEIAKAATISFHRIITAGEVPIKPVSPNVTLIKILAVILGLMFGISLIYAIHALKSRVNHEDTIYRLSDLPIAASVPFFTSIAASSKFFKGWVLQMELKKSLDKGSVLVVSSFNRKEGKSFISASLEKALMASERKILYVNAEKQVTNQLERPINWKAYLLQMKAAYDIILIKNFPLASNPIALLLMATADINLFVVDSRCTKQSCITETGIIQEELKLQNIQFVLNRAGYMPSLFTQVKNALIFMFRKVAK